MNEPSGTGRDSFMPTVQLRLFPPAKPLLERFGREFFGRVPACPGVYLMSGTADRLLYVGQSQNLRARLNRYKNLYQGADLSPGFTRNAGRDQLGAVRHKRVLPDHPSEGKPGAPPLSSPPKGGTFMDR